MQLDINSYCDVLVYLRYLKGPDCYFYIRIIYYCLAIADILDYYKKGFNAVICHIVCLCCLLL